MLAASAPFAVLVVENARFWRDYLTDSLARIPQITRTGCAVDCRGAREHIRGETYDLLVLELNLPDGAGLQFASECRQRMPTCRLLALTSRSDNVVLRAYATRLLDGLLWKQDLTAGQVPEAVRTIVGGGRYLAPGLRPQWLRHQHDRTGWWLILSDREQALVPWFGAGLSDTEIADAIGACAATIRVHRQHILAKLGLHRTIELMRWALAQGFIGTTSDLPHKPAA